MDASEKKKWAEKQLTQEQSLMMAKDGIWKMWTSEEVVRFQLFQEYLCMDFEHFHKSLEDVLGRPVFTHELAFRDGLVEEYLGTKEAPSLGDIINLFPHEKRSIIGLD